MIMIIMIMITMITIIQAAYYKLMAVEGMFAMGSMWFSGGVGKHQRQLAMLCLTHAVVCLLRASFRNVGC